MALPSEGPISFGAIRSALNGPPVGRPSPMSLYWGATNGVPTSGPLSFSHFRGRAPLRSVGGSAAVVDPALSVYGMRFLLQCSDGTAGGSLNFFGHESNFDPLVYHGSFRPFGNVQSPNIVQNTFSGGWAWEERRTYGSFGITNTTAPWALYFVMDAASFKIYRADTSPPQLVYTFNNRFPSTTPIRRFEASPYTCTRVLFAVP
eukprot:tig00000681_g3095.t1